MKGLEFSKKYYLQYGEPMLEREFPECVGLIAVGLVGSGSECFGYDDDISTDHDFEPGFCIFLPDENVIDKKTEFRLERAYAKLPKEFEGYARCPISPVGGSRHGVIRISHFFTEKVGHSNGELSTYGWLSTPTHALAEATNGEVFRDDLGLFTKIRTSLLSMPTDVKYKKLSGYLLLMAQSGQYNYLRCVTRTETGAAQLAAIEFVKSAMNVVFLLNDRYMPYYKWSFRAMRELPLFGNLADSFEFIISSENTAENSKLKYNMMEDISALIIEELRSRALTDAICGDLEKHAYSVNDKISEGDIRNMNIFCGVQ